MKPQDILDELERIADADHFVHEAYQLVDQWEAADAGVEAVEPILRFMEQHDDVDFGSPGPLVHFVEQFYKNGYEEQLFASLSRKPVSHTITMLHRILNDTHAQKRREKLFEILEAVEVHPDADEFTKERARELLEERHLAHRDQPNHDDPILDSESRSRR